MVFKDHFPQPNMDQKPKPPKQRINNTTATATAKSYLCLPRFRNTTTTTTTTSSTSHPRRLLSPAISLLDRLREAVFRLIMLSALSSATKSTRKQPDRASADRRENRARSHPYPSESSHYSEAVADCIEFIKKSSVTTADDRRDSSACSARSSAADGARGQPEREDKVSLELAEEIIQSMEVGMAFRDYSGRISSMDFHRTSSYLVTASADESIRLYDVANATCLKTINSKKYGVDLVCFTSHPTTVIYSSKNGWDESLRLLSLNDNKYLRYFKGHHDRVVSVSLCCRKECFISGSLDRTVLLWDQRAEKCQGLLHVQGRPATTYDDQGLVFAVAFGGCIRMFDARSYEKGPFEIFSVGGDMSDANVVKFSNDGRLMLLTTKDGHIYVLDSFRGTLLATFNVKPVLSDATLEASFSPEGMFVISGSGDGNVYAWSVRSGKEVASWMSTETEPPVIKWAPGSPMFVTGSSELSFWIPDLSKLGANVARK
ncbi:hypothetical protein RHMOL_Rhmol08G0040400 [Rhododendron molle]|uniref:Uncharacterized protein n=1 Tax=Rhododendron molle TaxID=49168 RepID=A0ACC0MJE8_RHOML|nr:hypothetical protein RHMOL_Rhmol08G0040400 [Rhododendron molle]